MVFPLSSWRTGAFAGFLALLSLGTACHKGNNGNSSTAGTITISGTVKYLRVPLTTVTDTNSPAYGQPLGLESDSTKFTSLPARGVLVRAFQQIDATAYDGTTYTSWVVESSANVASDGTYTLTVDSGHKTFVEVLSTAGYFDSTGALLGRINIFAEKNGMDPASPRLEPDRLMYALRKGLDGTAQTEPLVLPQTLSSANATVNFEVGLNDPWWITSRKSNWDDVLLTQAQGKGEIALEGPNFTANPANPGTGSRVLAILDSAYSFAAAFGNPSPSGYPLDLHYFYDCSSGQSAQTSYVDYDLAAYPTSHPNAFDGSAYHYFGLLQGGTASDDAFDEGVLFQMFGKNLIAYYSGLPYLPIPRRQPNDPKYWQDLQDLSPDLAMLEGMGATMAATLLKSPYLGDTTGQPGGGLNPLIPIRDIRDLTGLKKDCFSAPAIASLGWEIALKANSLTSPGTPTDWAKLDASALKRFFYLTSSNDIPNIFHQLTRLQEAKASTETIDLSAIFTDAALVSLLTPYNIPWPRPTTATAPDSPYISFTPFWEQDPNSLIKPLPPLVLSMANAHLGGNGQFPNVSWNVDDPMRPTLARGEVFTGMFAISKDTTFDLSLNTSPAIPAAATVKVFLGSPNTSANPAFKIGNTYSFGASSSTQHYQVPLGISGISSSSWAYIPVLVRLESPTVQLPSDLTVTVNLVPIH